MLALTNDAPKFCPECGRELDVDQETYLDMLSVSCICGTAMQFLKTDFILEVCEDVDGDLQYQDIHTENKLMPEIERG